VKNILEEMNSVEKNYELSLQNKLQQKLFSNNWEEILKYI
jgi:hypothetical protein